MSKNIIEGKISVDKYNFDYMLFDISNFIKIAKTNKKLLNSIEESFKKQRKKDYVNFLTLVKEDIEAHPLLTLYFIIKNNNEVIGMSRLTFKPNTTKAYISMVFTNENYRGKKICQKNIAKLIELMDNFFDEYELEVRKDNPAAIKCYENLGFKHVREHVYKLKNGSDLPVSIMELKKGKN
jgi:ribosomal protein S18 acetylase RimI-like enzyme